MNKPEKALWNYVSAGMNNRWDCQRHEDRYSKGIPDVSYGINGVNGWIELKISKQGKVNISQEQINWAISRGSRGGRCFVLIRDDSFNHLLVPYTLIKELKTTIHPLTKWEKLSGCGVWMNGIIWTEFAELIS